MNPIDQRLIKMAEEQGVGVEELLDSLGGKLESELEDMMEKILDITSGPLPDDHD